jgi:hypothetical protein
LSESIAFKLANLKLFLWQHKFVSLRFYYLQSIPIMSNKNQSISVNKRDKPNSTNGGKAQLYTKKYKVSIWASKHPYQEIPDDYFEERFSKNNTRASNQWSDNFKIRYFNPELMETNGSVEGLISIEKAVGECSFSSSYIQVLMSKAKKKEMLQVSWVILLFESEYSAKLSSVASDQYVTLLGAFDYDDDADSVFEIESDELGDDPLDSDSVDVD